MSLWATQGETICCIKGHPICDIAQDIQIGQGRSKNDFTNWRQREPDKSHPYTHFDAGLADPFGSGVTAIKTRSFISQKDGADANYAV